MRTDHLKIKIKTLAAEASIIRHATHKAKARVRWTQANGEGAAQLQAIKERNSLIDHRRQVVRPEARHSLLAYGFMKGTPYKAMENTCHEGPDWIRVATLVTRFGGGNSNNELQVWQEA